MENDLLKDMSSAQAEAIGELDRNLQIIACAGSGKTTVITRRIANILRNKPDVSYEDIVAFTFTEKAAESLKKKTAEVLGVAPEDLEGMYVGTIHSFCSNILRSYSGFDDYKVLDDVTNFLFVDRYYQKCGLSDLDLKRNKHSISLFLTCIEKMIDDYDNRDSWREVDRVVLQKYMDCMYEHKYISFALMIFEAIRQIDEKPEVQKYLEGIKYLVVDEYQDVDDLQERLIAKIAKAGANICVVGDDDQTIYQFRGSNADNMIGFSKRYPDVHQVKMGDNFRCAPGIVSIAECVIKNNQHRLSKDMKSSATVRNGTIKASGFEDEDEEYRSIAGEIKRLHNNGSKLKDIAVLVRKNKQIPPLVNALQKVGISCDATCTDNFFEGRYFSKFAATISCLNNLNKDELAQQWNDCCDRKLINKSFRNLRSCGGKGKISLSVIFDGFCDDIGFLNEDNADLSDRKAAFEAFRKIMDDYEKINGDYQLSRKISGMIDFLGYYVSDLYKTHTFETEGKNQDAVQIMSIHKSKGLDFETVFLPDLVKNNFPSRKMGGKKYWQVLGGTFEENKDNYESDIEDERKLFYVAVTRAKRNLYLSYVLKDFEVSCFVSEAADSPSLSINREDLEYRPTRLSRRSKKSYQTSNYYDDEEQTDEERALSQFEDWEEINYARKALLDYYGTACHFCPGAWADLVRIKNMDPNEILQLASANGLI